MRYINLRFTYLLNYLTSLCSLFANWCWDFSNHSPTSQYSPQTSGQTAGWHAGPIL